MHKGLASQEGSSAFSCLLLRQAPLDSPGLWNSEGWKGRTHYQKGDKKLHALTEEIFCCVSFIICILWEVIDLLAETFEVPWKTRGARAHVT